MRPTIIFAAAAAAAALLLAPAGHATTFLYTGVLSGAAESPPNASAGLGTVSVTFDDVAHTLRVESTFAGLSGTTTNAHIHAATATPLTGSAGVATTTPSFTGFPLGVSAGTFDATYDTLAPSTYNPAYVTANGGTIAGAESALIAAMNEGRSYFNIHTSIYPAGEVRAFLIGASTVPEPAGWATMLLGFGLVGASARRRLVGQSAGTFGRKA